MEKTGRESLNLIYAFCLFTGLRIPITYIVYTLSSIIGIGGFVYSAIHLLKPNRRSPDPVDE